MGDAVDHKTGFSDYKMNNLPFTNTAINNIVEYFTRRPQIHEYDSEFIKAAHAFYTKITTQVVPSKEIEKEYETLMKIPMSYSDMRGMFG